MSRSLSYLALLFSLCVNVNAQAADCDLPSIHFDNDFSGASTDKMIQSCHLDQANNHLTLTLQPEDTPINDSAWYSFKLSSEQVKHLKVSIKVKHGTNRYLPKVSHDGQHWQALAHTKTPEVLNFTLTLSKQPIWLSGQELITNADYAEWEQKLAKRPIVKRYKLGNSVQGRPIHAMEIVQNPNAKDWLVVLGRMHPPELTGAMALLPFVERLASEQSAAVTFRDNYNVLVVANMNPDGVALGHWRHNTQGVDLNRDWINFSQPEVQIIHKRIQQILAGGGRMAMAVDFHSTNRDVFYVMPTDYGLAHPQLVVNWLDGLDKALNKAKVNGFVVNPEPGTSPGKGVFKQYFADRYQVHAITYEMGDNTDRALIDIVAKQAATSLMDELVTLIK